MIFLLTLNFKLYMKSKRLIARLGLLGLLLFAMVQMSFGQGKTVTGKITSGKDGSPLANATVVVKGTTKGVTTDADGNFSIKVSKENAILVVSSVGFGRKEIPVAGQLQLSLSLDEIQGNQNEVVVVGYGTQRKRDLTGAVTSMSSMDFVKGALQTPEQLIAG